MTNMKFTYEDWLMRIKKELTTDYMHCVIYSDCRILSQKSESDRWNYIIAPLAGTNGYTGIKICIKTANGFAIHVNYTNEQICKVFNMCYKYAKRLELNPQAYKMYPHLTPLENGYQRFERIILEGNFSEIRTATIEGDEIAEEG